jgi:Integrase core domain
MITPPLVFVDLDHTYDRTTKSITDPQAQEVVHQLHSYTELSPSGTGLHMLAYGALPGKNIHTAIEMYGQDRFTTITTDHITGTPATIEQRQEAIAALYGRFAPLVSETTIYLMAVMDWYSRYVLSWEISITLDTSFCLDALDRALRGGTPEIFNTDQGVQFTSTEFVNRLKAAHIRISWDGRGRALDTAEKLDQEIDACIYKLYNLDDTEIRLIEKSHSI